MHDITWARHRCCVSVARIRGPVTRVLTWIADLLRGQHLTSTSIDPRTNVTVRHARSMKIRCSFIR